jgi:cytochrome c553
VTDASPWHLRRPGEAFFFRATRDENRRPMRIPTWIIAATLLAVPAIAMAGDGTPAAGKAKAEAAGCFACHGADGVATANGLAIDKYVPNLAAEPDLFLQFQLVFFRKGVRKDQFMSAIAQPLTDDDVRNLAAYFASLPAPKLPLPPDPAPADTELGAKVAQASQCSTCHGDHYEGVDNIGRLAGQREDYLYKALRDFKSGARIATGPAGMADVVYPLDDTEMKALAHYLSRLR